ncbi:MAG: UDP-N-acetylmuramate--L-alanine ligase [Patescibacteria group bacterium]|nr:MAG: UDP-N-acetylmuramate--L-alanine ligase [Patescibacteria group bacterium]
MNNKFLNQFKNIFFLGIKGVAMTNLAVFLKKMRKNIYGVDVEEEFITDKLLSKYNILYQNNFNNLPENIDLFVYSAAHQGLNNPLTKEAKKRMITVISQAELLGEIMKNFQNKIAVSGCHGKTTTSSLLSYALLKLNQKPSYIVGVPFFGDYQGGDYQEKKYFVVEADEYGINPPIDKMPKFLKLNPDWIICTNIDFDHPDVYKDIKDTKSVFLKFFQSKKLIVNIDDENIKEVVGKIKNNQNIYTYGFSDKADYQILDWQVNEDGSKFTIKNLGEFKIDIFGKHNILNATAVIVQLLKLGFDVDKVKENLKGFIGAKRRMELVFKGDFYIVDDYAHHPQEIKATLEAARERFKNKRLIVIFQPHTYSRTMSLLNDFKESLEVADIGFLLPIFASARENKGDFTVSSKDIVSNSKKLFYCENEDQLLKNLEKILKKNDVVFTMGAGDIYKLKVKIQNAKVKS